MRWPETLRPLRMARVAVVAPEESLRRALAVTADAGVLEPDLPDPESPAPGRASQALRRTGGGSAEPALTLDAPDPEQLARDGRLDLLAGEAELEARSAAVFRRGNVAALAGWTPERARPALAARLAESGAAVVPLPYPRGAETPTLLPGPGRGGDGLRGGGLRGGGLRGSLAPLVETYGTVPYADIDPTPLAWAAYVLMFGMMFGDAGHGLMLLGVAAALLAGWPGRLRRLRRAWPFVLGAAVTSIFFGLLYGEFFGPTGLLPVLWLNPLAEPVTLLVAAIGVGAVLLGGAYVIGIVNRWREGGWPVALYEPSGIAGASLFLGLGVVAVGLRLSLPTLTIAGALVAGTGLALAFAGFLAGAGGGGTGVAQAIVELFDLVVRLGANVVSFARLAAFGLAHAALAGIVWSVTAGSWARGGAFCLVAVVVFVVGTAVTFALEALVAGIQALRLEYYELFSRLFRVQGRPFRPWHIPIRPSAEREGMS
ncbi:V-type ATPase 116kDa subunit family protein [Actinomadura miaoliensis]|uniref:V-type ATP synthase subunit I n=1 Tax=Actinomadura miaoliensis TaxID=430685 RepID=A0ABP7W0C3_9ACTN